MTGRLFWKILLAFWLVFFLISQSVWVLFSLSRQQPPVPEPILVERVAPLVLQQIRAAIELHGVSSFERERAKLSPADRGRIELLPANATRANRDDDLNAAVIMPVTAGGRSYDLLYRYAEQPPTFGFFRIPPEVFALAFIGGLAFSALLASYLTQPIHRLREGFGLLARGEFAVRLSPLFGRRRDEIVDLARDFDRMAARLQTLVSARDNLLHDVSHELRTPLSRLQLAVGLARQDPARLPSTLDRIERESARLDLMVNELLTLARAESQVVLADEYFDLPSLLESIVADVQFEASAGGAAIELQLPVDDGELPSLRGSAELIRRAIENVLRNALKFSAAGQYVSVKLNLDRYAQRYRIAIVDQGPGVPDNMIESLFEPFVRNDTRRSGFGLGLSIAKRAVLAHGGTINAQNQPSGGLLVRIELPCTAG